MARYDIKANAQSFFTTSIPVSGTSWLLYSTPTSIGIVNSDGSKTYLTGTDFVWIPDLQNFGGAVTSINHYSASGEFIDSFAVDTAITSGFSGFTIIDALKTGTLAAVGFFQGDDVLDARYRAGNAVVNDVLNGGDGNDFVFGGSGNDLLMGSNVFNYSSNVDHDKLYGGSGNDRLRGDEQVNFQSGNDELYGESGSDILYGGGGNNILAGGTGADTAVMPGKFSSLVITATARGFTVLRPDGGTDTLTGIERIAADDGLYAYDSATLSWTRLSGGAGQSIAFAGATENGTSGADTFTTTGIDTVRVINGLGGNDTINVRLSAADVVVRGGGGNDTLTAALGSAAHRLYGDAGNDTIIGGGGNETLDGGDGADIVAGNLGNDRISGGAGADTFDFTITRRTFHSDVWDEGWNRDVISDFALGIDHIRINTVGTTAPEPTITDTADGLLVSFAFTGNTPAGNSIASILFLGLHGGGITLADLIG